MAAALALRAGWLDPSRVKEFILSFGLMAPVIWVLLYLVAVFIPYATTIMTEAAGLAFGVFWGKLLTYWVTLVASLLPFTVARRLGRAWVERRVGNTRLERYAELINRHAFLIFFYLRLIPSIPYEIQNHIAGVSRISYRQFLLATALGNGPILIILAFLGDGLTVPDAPQFWLAALLYALALLAAQVIALVRRSLGKPPLLEAPRRASDGPLPED
jgi:uncharacterized membrane protein YdjX (TVP38/TMEM64 family)